MTARPAAGGGRWVDVEPRRLRRWLDGFYQRHNGAVEEGLVLRAANGDTATLSPPPGYPAPADIDALLAGLAQPPRIGLMLARRGAAAVGVVDGDTLTDSKVERFYVQGRTAAGGWSQQRYARRRGNQAAAGVDEAAGIAARVLVPVAGSLAALVCGGDRATVSAILADPRLATLAERRADRFLDVAEPRRTVLEAAIGQARAVRIHLVP